MTDPLEDLLRQSLDLMNRAFVDPARPASVMCEFYHQFRKLWDKGIPVGLGLGHLLVKSLDETTLGIVRLGEAGKTDENLTAVCFGPLRPLGYNRTYAVAVENSAFVLK